MWFAWSRMQTLTQHVPFPRAAYSQARENLVKAIPPKLLCLLACGGLDCRYEGPECWKTSQQVIRGVFSSWVTDDIIAMARPSTRLIEKFNIIEQFQRLNIRSIINMQVPGEHAHCGPPLDPGSGFTYLPQIFMENDNFGVSSLVGIVDGVKVLAFAAGEGRVAVHCHAGLGRTGVLIACYLVYTLRISPSEAVHYVRIKRPRSIQTRAQISQVFDFARLLGTQLLQYPDLGLRHGAPVTLQHYLNRQALLLHGQEARKLKYTPKVIYLLCVRLSCLALALPTAPEIDAELEKRSALRILSRTVRETLVSKQHLPLLRERHNIPRPGSGSVSSWDEPLGFSESKRDLLLNKRSYSDSDLGGIADLRTSRHSAPTFENEGHWCAQDVKGPDRRPFSSRTLLLDKIHKNQSHTRNMQPNGTFTKRSKCTVRKALPKSSSTTELCRNWHDAGTTRMARAIANAMADHAPPGQAVLQRSSLLQEEMNSSQGGWALMVTEWDPHVLACLLWTWLEKLKEPVLSVEDIAKLSCAGSNKPLGVLNKSQKHTIYCLLSCVSTVTHLCPHREDAVLQRLIQALTKIMPDEEPWVGSWRPHRPRGPIAALYGSPGPKYALPSLTGSSKHDPTKNKAPSYSFRASYDITKQDISPGPKHLIPSNITKNGRDGARAFSFGSRPKDLARFQVPAPNRYHLENADKYTYNSSPSYTLSGRWKEVILSNQTTPGPASNSLPPVIGPKTVNIAAAPAHSLYGRSKNGNFFEDYTKTPGPAAYEAVDPKIYLRKSPQYSMPGRKFAPINATATPAPGVYCPEKVTTVHSKAPAFTFGLRHSQYTICPIMDVDKYQQSFSFL
ncbi:protein tyrosine phosphatase domain-containing protein 1 isoform X3 [Nerophis ophidion]|uniref:protein tyrosine phosphatase domain-containing protein 1 isoform X3 n=1 Tax=Nerophis ophidion TaxID=159077 RepID=UPI002ADFBCDF|nr:protein tyrosine phosphatase domain-containing protein 1 isoform X3 [Nerophis ophidion]